MARRADLQSVLRFEGVSLQFDGGALAVNEVSFSANTGDTRMIVGAAGSGKTVLMKLALGLLRPTSGKIFLFDDDVSKYSEQDWFEVRSRIGALFQEGGLFDSLTIEENVGYPLLNQSRFQKEGKKRPEDVRDSVHEALQFVELGDTMSKYPSELSGGMRRRVGIARATVTDPELLLYDSPTAGLDPITANTIIALIVKERELRSATAMIITHRFQDGHMLANFRYNPDSTRLERITADSPVAQSTQYMVMKEGRLVFEGTEQQLDASTDRYISRFSMLRNEVRNSNGNGG